MASAQSIGKMQMKLTDAYCDQRNGLYEQYVLNCECSFSQYVTGRKIIFERYAEIIDRLEWRHSEKIQPIDFGYRAEQEVLDKDICIEHAPSLIEFERGRFDADAHLISKLNQHYKEYQITRQELDREYQADRTAAYTEYRNKRDELENEGHGEPASNS